MASLRSIMNLEDDSQSDPRVIKREPGPSSSAPRVSLPPHTSSASSHSLGRGSTTLQAHHNQHPSSHPHYPTQPLQQLFLDSRYSTSSHDRRTTPLVQNNTRPASPEDFSPASSSSLVSTSRQATSNPGYRESHTPDPMDHQGYPYSHHGMPSSMPPLPHPHSLSASGPSARAYGSSGSGDAQAPVKYTPVTGRVSKALKGVPVHTCNDCVPPRTFTRNEHLKRHQLSHKTPSHECQMPGCGRKFHRKDLLDRHEQKHEQERQRGLRDQNLHSTRRRPHHSPAGSGLGIRHSPYPTVTGRMSQRYGGSSMYTTSTTTSMPVGVYHPATTTIDGTATPSSCLDPPTPLSPCSNGRADAYGRPLSQGRQTFGNNYVFPTSLSHQLPVIQHQHQSMNPQENPLHLVGYSDVQAPRRPNLHLKFASPANNHGGLAPCSDAPGIPSSASSTYSTGSDLTRSNRSTARSSSVEWVPSGFLSPSPIPTSQAGSIELLSPISMDASGSVHASSPPPASTRLSMEAMDYQHQLSYSSPQRIPRISNTAYDKTGALSTNLGYSGGSALLDYSHPQPACSIMPLFQNDSMRMPLRERY